MGRHGVAETLTGAFVLVVALAFLAYAVLHSGRTAGSGYTLRAQFDNIAGLSVGGDVRIAGVKVGSVTSEHIDPKTFSAVVAMTVQNDIQLPKDISASIISESLLGGKYISLSPGGDETNLQARSDHHDHPVRGQPGGASGQVHLQRHQPEQPEGTASGAAARPAEGQQPDGGGAALAPLPK